MGLDANKVIETLNARYAKRISDLEKEVSFLLVKNQQLEEDAQQNQPSQQDQEVIEAQESNKTKNTKNN